MKLLKTFEKNNWFVCSLYLQQAFIFNVPETETVDEKTIESRNKMFVANLG